MAITFKLHHVVHQAPIIGTDDTNDELDIYLTCVEKPRTNEAYRNRHIVPELDLKLRELFGPDVVCGRVLDAEEQEDPSDTDENNAKCADHYHIIFAFKADLSNSKHLDVKWHRQA